MKIKKNGKTINLTESDIKILSKRLLKEDDQGVINAEDNSIHHELERRVSALEKKVYQLERLPADGLAQYTIKQDPFLGNTSYE